MKINTNLWSYVGGLIGCKGDAFTGVGALNRQESQIFHEWEVSLFAEEKVSLEEK